ncbi:uncharacterized protein DEA37_0002815, partial [Paragonimus westermani]
MASACDSQNGVSKKIVKDSSSKCSSDVQSVLQQFAKNVILLPQSDHVRVLQTVIRNKETTRNEFLFHADRLIRLVVEEGLNQLP